MVMVKKQIDNNNIYTSSRMLNVIVKRWELQLSAGRCAFFLSLFYYYCYCYDDDGDAAAAVADNDGD